MNRISLFTLLILLFLGLSKSFSPSEKKTDYIVNERVLRHYFKSNDPISLILLDAFQAGFLIKTYYLKLKVVHGFKTPNTIVVRTSKKFWEKHEAHIGMSIYRKMSKKTSPSTVVLPPGSLYIGNSAFGRWQYHDSGEKYWYFYSAYRNFPSIFQWDTFRPSQAFYQAIVQHLKNELPFFGLHSEFGTEGHITKKILKNRIDQTIKEKVNFKDIWRTYITLPPWESGIRIKKDGA